MWRFHDMWRFHPVGLGLITTFGEGGGGLTAAVVQHGMPLTDQEVVCIFFNSKQLAQETSLLTGYQHAYGPSFSFSRSTKLIFTTYDMIPSQRPHICSGQGEYAMTRVRLCRSQIAASTVIVIMLH